LITGEPVADAAVMVGAATAEAEVKSHGEVTSDLPMEFASICDLFRGQPATPLSMVDPS